MNITSADDGLVGKDAVLIKDGAVHITASGNGIKSTKSEADQGYVYIGGGTVNITAEQDGTIVEICAQNGQAVEYGTPLFRYEEG